MTAPDREQAAREAAEDAVIAKDRALNEAYKLAGYPPEGLTVFAYNAGREAAVRECMSEVDDVSLTEKYGSRVYKCLLGLKQRMRDLLRPPPASATAATVAWVTHPVGDDGMLAGGSVPVEGESLELAPPAKAERGAEWHCGCVEDGCRANVTGSCECDCPRCGGERDGG